MKKAYLKPTMNVVKLQHQCQILAGSVNSLNNADGIIWKTGGFTNGEEDY